MKKQITFLVVLLLFTTNIFAQEYNEITDELHKSEASPQGNSNGWIISNLTFRLKVIQNEDGPGTYKRNGNLLLGRSDYTIVGYRFNGKLYKLGQAPFTNHENHSGYFKVRFVVSVDNSHHSFEKTTAAGLGSNFEIDRGYKSPKSLSNIKLLSVDIIDLSDNHMEYVLNNYLKSEKQNELTQISNTGDDFWNGSASNNTSNSQTQQYSQTNSDYNKNTKINTSGLTKEQIEAHEDFKQKQQEQMQYVQAKIDENRQNVQNLQKAADETGEEWKNGNYIQGSSHLANEYAKQGNEEAAIGTLAVGVGLDIYSSIKADRERKKTQEAQERQSEKVNFEKEKLRREKFVESHKNATQKLIEDGNSIFDISTINRKYKVSVSGLTDEINATIDSRQLAEEYFQFDYFYLTFVTSEYNNSNYSGSSYDYKFATDIPSSTVFKYSKSIKLSKDILKNDSDFFIDYLKKKKYYNPENKILIKDGKLTHGSSGKEFLFFSTNENPFENFKNEKKELYSNLNITFVKKDDNTSHKNIPQEYLVFYKEYEKNLIEAKNGNAEAMLNLGHMYAEGKDKNRHTDFSKEEYWYRKSAEKGNLDAMYNLAEIKIFTEGFRSNEGVNWLEKASENGHIEATHKLGYLCLFLKDWEKAEYLLKKSAEKGKVESMFELGGDLYIMKKDYIQAIFWLEKAANLGDLTSIKKLAEIRTNGGYSNKGKVLKEYISLKDAKYWHEKACSLGDNNSCETLKSKKFKNL